MLEFINLNAVRDCVGKWDVLWTDCAINTHINGELQLCTGSPQLTTSTPKFTMLLHLILGMDNLFFFVWIS